MKKIVSNLKKDFPASIVVFLVALPLCLGIALASGAPLVSGLLAGIIGGVVVGSFSKSHLSVSGPAAGLITIVLGAIDSLGGFNAFLLAVLVAGLFQFLLGVLKAGVIGMYFPTSVIKGMLAAIGLTLILKQIPHLVGFDSDAFGEMDFIQAGNTNTVSYLISSFDHIHVGATLVGITSLVFMLLWGRPFIKQNKYLNLVPGGVVAVTVGIVLNAVLDRVAPSMAIRDIHMVNLPVFENFSELGSLFRFPDFSQLSNPNIYVVAILLALVGSLETLLSVEAVDKLDPQKRRTPKNAELRAQGIGNMIAGLIGGLPITAVIVRSSANLGAGAKSKASAILHGVFLILSITLLARFINYIPLTSLAAILLLVGFKLTNPSIYKTEFKLGYEQFIPFIVTIVAIFLTNLLWGIGIGLGTGIVFILVANHRIPYHYHKSVHHENGKDEIRIELSEHVSFLNKASLLVTLEELPENSHVIIDGTKCEDIHHDALEVIYNFAESTSEKNITFELRDLPKLTGTINHH